jgi:hypothetical protein
VGVNGSSNSNQINQEEGRIWTVQGYKDDETVHAYPSVCVAERIHSTPYVLTWGQECLSHRVLSKKKNSPKKKKKEASGQGYHPFGFTCFSVWRAHSKYLEADFDVWYLQSSMVDVIIRQCSGNRLQTIVASHGPCHYLIVQDCNKMVVLADAAAQSVHLTDCSMVCKNLILFPVLLGEKKTWLKSLSCRLTSFWVVCAPASSVKGVLPHAAFGHA